MVMARPASEPQIFYPSDDAADGELARVLRTTDPGPALTGPLTFSPADDWPRAWETWRERTLGPLLAPVLQQTCTLAARGCAREMLALDRELDTVLDADARVRSRAAGRRLLVHLASSRGERWLGRFQQWAVAGETPAHFPIIYAGQHALFHLSPRLLIPAYAYWEWSAAMTTRASRVVMPPDFSREIDALSRLAQDSLPSPSSPYAVENLPAAAGDR